MYRALTVSRAASSIDLIWRRSAAISSSDWVPGHICRNAIAAMAVAIILLAVWTAETVKALAWAKSVAHSVMSLAAVINQAASEPCMRPTSRIASRWASNPSGNSCSHARASLYVFCSAWDTPVASVV